MTVSSGFFNSVNHDRLYDAEQLSSIFDGIILDGVYEAYGDAFKVIANSDIENSVIVGTGRAWFDHTWTLNDSQAIFSVSPPNEMLDRYDAICIDVDRRQTVRSNSLVVVNGVLGSPAQYPTLINEDLHKQYPIAYIKRTAGGSSTVTNSDIEIKIGSEDCPLVTGILDAMNTDMYVQQLNADFNAWWDGIKDLIGENPVLNLQNQIDDINEKNEYQDIQINRLNAKVFSFTDGRNLGTQITDEQHSAIAAGNFSDFLPGDYWTFNGTKYYVVGYDSFLGMGDTDGTNTVTDHHLVVAPGKTVSMKDIDVTLSFHNQNGGSDEIPYFISADFGTGYVYGSINAGYTSPFTSGTVMRVNKTYALPTSKYVEISESDLSSIESDLGANALTIPQPVPTDFQNFEVKWSKAIIPYDFQIDLSTSSSYYTMSDSQKVDFMKTHPSFYIGLLGYKVPSLVSGKLQTIDRSIYATFLLSHNDSILQSTFADSSATLRGYLPTYRANSLFKPFYKCLIDPMAENYYNNIGISTIQSGHLTFYLKNTDGLIGSSSMDSNIGYAQYNNLNVTRFRSIGIYADNYSTGKGLSQVFYVTEEEANDFINIFSNLSYDDDDYLAKIPKLEDSEISYRDDLKVYQSSYINANGFQQYNCGYIPKMSIISQGRYASYNLGRDYEDATHTSSSYNVALNQTIIQDAGYHVSFQFETSENVVVPNGSTFFTDLTAFTGGNGNTGQKPLMDASADEKKKCKPLDHIRLIRNTDNDYINPGKKLVLCAIK